MFKKEEVHELIRRLLEANERYDKESIVFTDYCKTKLEERGIEKSLIISTILLNKDLYYAEKQEVPLKGDKEIRYKTVYKISSRYSLIIIAVYEEKILKVINVIKTSKSAEKLWRKKVSG